ncbi:MAG: hypothetical protein WBW41_00120 [Verrucomicrobiia bacterium]
MKTSRFRTRTASLAGALLLAVTLSAQAGGKHATETQTFTIAAGAKITAEGNKSATLADIKAGDHVSIAYTQANGVLTATHIRDAGPNPVKHSKNTNPTSTTKKHVATGLHAHGIVQSVDVSNPALTITEKRHH